MLPMQYTTTHATHKASMCPSCESCIKLSEVCNAYKGCFRRNPKYSDAPSQFQTESKHYLIMNEIRDEHRIFQIATERSDSCGDRRRAILLTTHSTFTQQTQYTDNKATINEKQFFLLPARHLIKVGCLRGRHLNKGLKGVLSYPRRCSYTPPPFSDIAQQCSQHITCAGHEQ